MDNFFKNVCYAAIDNELIKYKVDFGLPLNFETVEIICEITTENVYNQVKSMLKIIDAPHDFTTAVRSIASENVEEYICLKFSINDKLSFTCRAHNKFPSLREIITLLISRHIIQLTPVTVPVPTLAQVPAQVPNEEDRPKVFTGSGKKSQFILGLKSKKDKEKEIGNI